MSVDFPDAVAARLQRAAARRGLRPEDLAVTTIDHAFPDSSTSADEQQEAVDAFFGSGDSGDPTWASRDIDEIRSELAARKLAEGA